MAKLFRVILPVSDIEQAAAFYSKLLEQAGRRVSPGRHYFDCGDVILACFDPRREDGYEAKANPEHIYFAVPDLETVFDRARTLACREIDEQIMTRPWGERSFYFFDPFGNPICFVDARTVFTGQSVS
jgi:predicted enzyme related to lactoylglutathione lyase